MVGDHEEDEQLDWKVPIWQPRIGTEHLALHNDGPLSYAKKEGYLQKRAGKSRFRWNVRWFEILEGEFRWWRPKFTEQCYQPSRPSVAKMERRPRPKRCLDLTQLQSVVRTRVKFPYSTRIALKFHASYTDYEIELRAENELEIIEWYKLFSRFTMETYEAEVEAPEVAEEGVAEADARAGESSDEDSEPPNTAPPTPMAYSVEPTGGDVPEESITTTL